MIPFCAISLPSPDTSYRLLDLDGIYKHAEYTSVTLTSLATGSRQRRGAILLFAFTFNRKLEFSLGYDKSAFRGGAVEEWWSEVEKGVKEFLIV